ncbi:MAG: DUF305 domain-containing protein [Acidobacteria bacterium]|nr:DUF305 domain-containing protein [Acidobacteriota bacterium]
MAKMVDGKTQNPDIKKFAAQIIADQEKEIGQMKGWRSSGSRKASGHEHGNARHDGFP